MWACGRLLLRADLPSGIVAEFEHQVVVGIKWACGLVGRLLLCADLPLGIVTGFEHQVGFSCKILAVTVGCGQILTSCRLTFGYCRWVRIPSGRGLAGIKWASGLSGKPSLLMRAVRRIRRHHREFLLSVLRIGAWVVPRGILWNYGKFSSPLLEPFHLLIYMNRNSEACWLGIQEWEFFQGVEMGFVRSRIR